MGCEEVFDDEGAPQQQLHSGPYSLVGRNEVAGQSSDAASGRGSDGRRRSQAIQGQEGGAACSLSLEPSDGILGVGPVLNHQVLQSAAQRGFHRLLQLRWHPQTLRHGADDALGASLQQRLHAGGVAFAFLLQPCQQIQSVSEPCLRPLGGSQLLCCLLLLAFGRCQGFLLLLLLGFQLSDPLSVCDDPLGDGRQFCCPSLGFGQCVGVGLFVRGPLLREPLTLCLNLLSLLFLLGQSGHQAENGFL